MENHTRVSPLKGDLPKPTMMVIENDRSTCELISSIAELEGYACQKCESAEEGLNRIQEAWKHGNFYRILVIDLYLDGIDGADLCEILRGKKIPRNNHRLEIPSWIIATSSDSKPLTIRALLRAGANDFLPKPLRREALTSRFLVAEHHLNKQGHRRAIHRI